MKQLLLLFWLLFAAGLSAQVRISGRVLDETDNAPLIGAVVREKGAASGTATDVDGKFALNVSSPQAIIVVDYIGYKQQEFALQGRIDLEIRLAQSQNLIDEVVVIGYGVQRKSDLTGAVGTVKARDIERIPTASVEQALQGKIAGVYVSPASGEPGRGAIIRVRGTGTLNDAGPLFVVDGMVVDNAEFVNPRDIASIEVLKDASSTAIYGNRGSNGVILITTKRGTNNRKAVFNLGSYYGTQQIAKKLSLANASQFAEMYNQLKGSPAYPDPKALGEGTDWQDIIFSDAPISNLQMGVNGMWKKLNYSLSGNLFDQRGILNETGFTRYSGRFNGEYPVLKQVKLGTNLSYTRERRESVGGNPLGGAYRIPSLFPERDSLGNFSDPTAFGQSIGNPAADLFYRNDQHTRINRWVGTVYAQWRFLNHFNFKSSYGFDRKKEGFYAFEPIFKVTSAQLNNLEKTTKDTTTVDLWLWENTLNYDNQWNWLRLNVLAGQSMQAYEYRKRNNVNNILQPNGETFSDWAIISYIFRSNVTIMDRYLFTASLRADGSSRFNKNNRWGYFPALALGWNVAQESFMQDQQIFDRLKLRASWGITGNDKVQNYPSLGIISDELYGVFNDTIQPGATLIDYANADIRWETTKQLDFGLEFSVLNGRLSFEADWYKRFTYDILSELPIPDYVGSARNPYVNAAEVQNTGWDMTLQWRETRSRITYNLGILYSPVKNEVLALNEGKSEIFSGQTAQNDFATRTVVGLPIGAFYGYKVAGIFQNAEEIASLPKFGNEKPGDFRFADLNGDGLLDSKDRTFLGSPIPDFTYGFNAGIEAFGFDIAADFLGVKGNKVVNAKAVARFDTPNWETLWYDGHWTGEGTSNTVPRVTNGGHNYRMSDFLVEDGSFLRLRSAVIGYTFPAGWLDKAGISKLRLYASGTNIWTKQSYSGFTPEFPNNDVFRTGLDFLNYPMSKTFLFGLDVNF